MDGQMTVFEFLPVEEIALENMTGDDLARIMKNATGLDFIPDKYGDGYVAKMGKVELSTRLGRYKMNDNTNRFISVGWFAKDRGRSGPHDSVDDAIKAMRKCVDEAKEMK